MSCSGAGTAYPSEAHEFTPVFSGVRVTRSIVICVCIVGRCFCTFSFGHCVLRYTDSDYPFGIFKLFLQYRSVLWILKSEKRKINRIKPFYRLIHYNQSRFALFLYLIGVNIIEQIQQKSTATLVSRTNEGQYETESDISITPQKIIAEHTSLFTGIYKYL